MMMTMTIVMLMVVLVGESAKGAKGNKKPPTALRLTRHDSIGWDSRTSFGPLRRVYGPILTAVWRELKRPGDVDK
jgi:hypothetical protein